MKLYVGNISFNLGSQEIRSIFSEFGRIESADVIYDRATGRSRGFAFVRMVSADDGESAIGSLHGSVVEGRPLVVSESKPSANKPAGNHFTAHDVRSDASSTYYGGRSW